MAEHSRDCAPDVMDVRDFPQLVAATNEGGASNGSGSVNPLGVAACGKVLPILDAKESVDWNELFSWHTLSFYPPVKRGVVQYEHSRPERAAAEELLI
ncbi:hypothetical protein V6N11_026014 [Hibiscus sabdariffa]|uniref:Uncharacterized protein n=1 Tax=Hibiscus sabdariffa TaxID=183260 RepID=A0ABR2SUE8_9ROSI